jgi:hypothetical protein
VTKRKLTKEFCASTYFLTNHTVTCRFIVTHSTPSLKRSPGLLKTGKACVAGTVVTGALRNPFPFLKQEIGEQAISQFLESFVLGLALSSIYMSIKRGVLVSELFCLKRWHDAPSNTQDLLFCQHRHAIG